MELLLLLCSVLRLIVHCAVICGKWCWNNRCMLRIMIVRGWKPPKNAIHIVNGCCWLFLVNGFENIEILSLNVLIVAMIC